MCLERRVLRQHDGVQRHAIVCLLERVDQRSAAHGDLALGGKHLRMTGQPLHLHRQGHLDGIALLPLPADRRVASRNLRRHRRPVHPNNGSRRPAREPDVQRELARRVGLDGDLHVAVPRVVRTLPHRDLARVQRRRRVARDEQVDPQPVGRAAVDVLTERRQEARDRRRTARHTEPRRALEVAAAGERRDVAEEITAERDTSGDGVVQRLLHHVGVFRVAGQIEQPVVPEDHRRRGTGLLVGGLVRQIVIFGKPFVVFRRSDAAGDVHPVQRHAVVQGFRRIPQPGVALFVDEIGHPAVEEHRAHRVSDGFLLLANGQMVLRVARIELLRVFQVEPLVPFADAKRLAEEIDGAVGVELRNCRSKMDGF